MLGNSRNFDSIVDVFHNYPGGTGLTKVLVFSKIAGDNGEAEMNRRRETDESGLANDT